MKNLSWRLVWESSCLGWSDDVPAQWLRNFPILQRIDRNTISTIDADITVQTYESAGVDLFPKPGSPRFCRLIAGCSPSTASGSVPIIPAVFMATIKPFAALRPKPELASQICELPYDVMSSEEARVMAAGNPLSFLHVSKPEIDLSPDTDVYSDAVYAKGRENFQRLIADGSLRQDENPCFYLYRQVMGKHSQLGLVAAASCQEYLDGVIKKHEFTRPDKEDDRVRHIEALNSQTGPVFLTYRSISELDTLFAKVTEGQPDVDFTGTDGVRHTAWTVVDAETIAKIEGAFAAVPFLYIADGHHRSAAAGRVFQSRSGAGQSFRFLTVIFPHDQMQILAYNRALKDLNGRNADALLVELAKIFEITPSNNNAPAAKHQFALYVAGNWYRMIARPEFTKADNPVDRLDVSILQRHVLAPLFAIEDPRTSKRISFVGGIRGTGELEKMVNSGNYACAFAMYPTSIVDLMAIADAGEIMPPKSTWFEPKLRDAMFCHML